MIIKNIFEHNLICVWNRKKIQFNVLHMMSNVAWPKWKIYYDFLQSTLQCLFKGETKFRENCYW